ncbi:GDSL-like Lipase/Acylhydrolase [Pseudomonas fluorescens]|nr:GDSL-like Lipase/Acylhydrolase [Pseudomonas fluorescens]
MRAALALTALIFASNAFAKDGPDGAHIDEDFHTCYNLSCSATIVSKFNTDKRALTGQMVYGEPFYLEEGAPKKHKTIFHPTKINFVYSPYTGEIFKPGKDYNQTEDGLELTPDSSMKMAPHGFSKDMSGDERKNYNAKVTPAFQDYQYAVTYSKKEIITPISYGSLGDLNNRLGKSTLKVTFFGDSITLGANATSTYVAPNQPGYVELVMAYLNTRYPSTFEYRNNAVGGWNSFNAASAVSYRVLDKKSDLVVLGFGMNDSGGVTPQQFKDNMEKVVSDIRTYDKTVPILLISSTVANPESTIQKPELLQSHLSVLREIENKNTNIALVDVTTTWQKMLINKKYFDLTGNGLNHPNDFGHRVIAESVLAAILGPNF